MQGGDRNRRQNQIPSFPDPFAGFGMQDPFGGFGIGGGRSLFSQMFDRDPFDDPFFTQPFGGVFGSSGGLFGPPASLFRRGSLLGNDESFDPFGRQTGGFLEHRPFPPQQESRRGPVIEELPDDDDGNQPSTNTPRSRASREPIVEHPDEDAIPDNARSQRLERHQPNRGQPSVTSHSYSFSSVSYGGPNGTYYSTSTTRRAGADGIVEEEHEEQDARAGKAKEIKRLSRALGEKGHSVTRKRDASGENYLETLHNLTEEEKNEFDESWKKRAEKSLPGWKRNRERLPSSGSAGYNQQNRLALPSNRGFVGEWSGARQA